MSTILTAIDFGSSKVSVLVAKKEYGESLSLLGLGDSNCNGLRQGVIINMESTLDAVHQSIKEAQLVSGVEIDSVYINLSGDHLEGVNHQGIVAVHEGGGEIHSSDIQRAIESSKSRQTVSGKELVYALPRDFSVDGQSGIPSPLGMTGSRLEADVHLIYSSGTAVKNAGRCVENAGLHLMGLIPSSIASAYGVLSNDEMEVGTLLIDIGAGTSDISVFAEGSLRHTSCMALGGYQITQNLAKQLKVTMEKAEDVKVRYGRCLAVGPDTSDAFIIPGIGGRENSEMSIREFSHGVITPLMEEQLRTIYKHLEGAGILNQLGAGIVLSGGVAQTQGIRELAEDVFHVPARVGRASMPQGLTDCVDTPIHAVGTGLIKYAGGQIKERHTRSFRTIRSNAKNISMQNVVSLSKEWCKNKWEWFKSVY